MQRTEQLRRALGADARSIVDDIELFEVIDSTNSYLMRSSAPSPGRARLAIADDQSHGRGRHDRHWETAPGSCLCLSLAYTFERTPEHLAVLTLLMGVAVATVLSGIGLQRVRLKWPNDIVVDDAKLGGLLAETQLRPDRSVTVVAGVGINLQIPPELSIRSSSTWAHAATDLASCLPDAPERDQLAAGISDELLRVFRAFETGETAAALTHWRRYDWLRGKRIRVDDGDNATVGTAGGVDDEGLLLVETDSGVKRIFAGTISLLSEA
ncbi:MAG: biotin--[acetyl-CoA-carboxylase] ligase [Pseudomonadota bacterium]